MMNEVLPTLHLKLKKHHIARQETILHDIEWEAPRGGLTVLVGPNGAGKSTLLRLLTGWEAPSEGEVRWGGQLLTSFSPYELAERRVFLPQDATRYAPALSVYEVVTLGLGKPSGSRGPGEYAPIVKAALEWMGLVEHASRNYRELSGGEQQRVHLARCRVQLEKSQAAAWGILDEPIQSLDPFYQHAVLRYCAEWAALKPGVIVISLHQLGLAAHYAHTVLVLHQGRVVAQGNPVDALKPELLERIYGIQFEWISRQDKMPVLAETYNPPIN